MSHNLTHHGEVLIAEFMRPLGLPCAGLAPVLGITETEITGLNAIESR